MMDRILHGHGQQTHRTDLGHNKQHRPLLVELTQINPLIIY